MPGSDDLSQNKIKSNIRLYLKYKGHSPQLIKQFQDGYCHGLAVLAAYGQYLSCQPENKQPCDDWEWFSGVLTLLAGWDAEILHLTRQNEMDIDRFINQIEFFQHVSKYLSHGQGSLEHYLTDTRHRSLIQEFTFAGLLCAQDFVKPIRANNKTTSLIDELLKYDQRMIIISCGSHTLSVFRQEDSVTLYDSNHSGGLQHFSRQRPQAIIDAIYKAYHYNRDLPSPIGFRLFSFTSMAGEYVSAREILSQLQTPLAFDYPGNRKNYTALHIAARVGSAECTSYFLEQGANTDAEDTRGQTPVRVALSRRYPDIVTLIQRHRQSLNDNHYGVKCARFFSSSHDEQNINIETLPNNTNRKK